VSRFFAAVPLDFDRLFQRDAEITPRIYALGCHLSAESYRRRNTDDSVIEIFPSSLAELFGVGGRTVRRWLRILEEKEQIRCEVRKGQRGPWRITLRGLANPATWTPADAPVSGSEEGLVQVGVQVGVQEKHASGKASSPRPAQPVSQSVSQSSALTNETNLAKPLDEEEKLDHLEGETAAAEFDAAEFIREQRERDPIERAGRFDEMFPRRPRRAS
jgi:hypothetical protein